MAIPDVTWMDSALCAQVGPDLFFPSSPGEHLTSAKKLCRKCPVAEQCLAWGLRGDRGVPYGVYGGAGSGSREIAIKRRRANRNRRLAVEQRSA